MQKSEIVMSLSAKELKALQFVLGYAVDCFMENESDEQRNPEQDYVSDLLHMQMREKVKLVEALEHKVEQVARAV